MNNTASYGIKVDQRFSDWDDLNSYRGMHNQDHGPGQYSIPSFVAVENKPLSSCRNTPQISIGLPLEKNKPYFPEVKTDFVGRSSPAVNKYSPKDVLTKPKDPSFS
jgi:hypothetical protein